MSLGRANRRGGVLAGWDHPPAPLTPHSLALGTWSRAARVACPCILCFSHRLWLFLCQHWGPWRPGCFPNSQFSYRGGRLPALSHCPFECHYGSRRTRWHEACAEKTGCSGRDARAGGWHVRMQAGSAAARETFDLILFRGAGQTRWTPASDVPHELVDPTAREAGALAPPGAVPVCPVKWGPSETPLLDPVRGPEDGLAFGQRTAQWCVAGSGCPTHSFLVAVGDTGV